MVKKQQFQKDPSKNTDQLICLKWENVQLSPLLNLINLSFHLCIRILHVSLGVMLSPSPHFCFFFFGRTVQLDLSSLTRNLTWATAVKFLSPIIRELPSLSLSMQFLGIDFF